MLVHRFQDYWASEVTDPILTSVGVGVCIAFVPCPCPLSFAQQAHAEFLYRLAFERAQAEVARERRARWTTFSQN